MRGEVYAYKPRGKQGHEQREPRYAIVVSATRFEHLSTWIVVPTSTRARAYGFRPEVTILDGTTLALCDAVTAVDPEKALGEAVGYLSLAEMKEIEEALAILMDIDTDLL